MINNPMLNLQTHRISLFLLN